MEGTTMIGLVLIVILMGGALGLFVASFFSNTVDDWFARMDDRAARIRISELEEEIEWERGKLR